MRQFCLILLLCSTAIGGNSTATVLVNRLGNAKYVVREHASAALSGMVPQAEACLKSAYDHSNKEVAVRSKLIVSNYYREQSEVWSKKIFPDGYSRMPWIDKLPASVSERDEIIRLYLAKASTSADRYKVGWPAYRLATELYVKDLIELGWGKEKIIKLLNQMAVLEIKWIRKYGHKYTPPIELPK